MVERGAASIRARVRAEMVDEIKSVARQHLAVEGANLSLRAVARDMGMVSSALYRYFASRDELLTALIIDAYNSMGEAAEAADAGFPDRRDLPGRWLAVASALRTWALARPHEYALIYGSPVPGYAAPADTVGPSTRPVVVLGQILSARAAGAGAVGAGAGGGRPDSRAGALVGDRLPPALAAELRRIAGALAVGVNEPGMARALIVWTQLFGAISFELFGRLNNTISERDAWFEYQMRATAAWIGIAPA